MILYQGKLMIEKGGWWWWAGQDKRFERIVTRALITKEERDAYGVLSNEIGVVASLYVKGQKEPYTTGFGRAARSGNPVIRGSAVEANHPYLMAEKRAEVQAIRKFRPLGEPPNVTAEDIAAMKEVASSDEGNIIEGQSRDISDATEIPPSDAGSPAAAPVTPPDEETHTEPDANPFPKLTAKYGDMLAACWVHGDSWMVNKFNKRSHKDGEGWCNLVNLLRPITETICKEAGIEDGLALNEKVKKEYDGKTWSKLSESEQLTVLESLMK
jgi:hypothetical protein